MTCSRPSPTISMEIQPYATVPVTSVFLCVHEGRSGVLPTSTTNQPTASQLQLVNVTLRPPPAPVFNPPVQFLSRSLAPSAPFRDHGNQSYPYPGSSSLGTHTSNPYTMNTGHTNPYYNPLPSTSNKRYARNRSSTQGRIFKLRPLDPSPPPTICSI